MVLPLAKQDHYAIRAGMTVHIRREVREGD